MTTVKMLFFVVLLIGVSGAGLVVGVGKAWIDTTPDLDLEAIGARRRRRRSSTTTTGEPHHRIQGTENRIYVGIDEIPAKPHRRRDFHRGRALLRAQRN